MPSTVTATATTATAPGSPRPLGKPHRRSSTASPTSAAVAQLHSFLRTAPPLTALAGLALALGIAKSVLPLLVRTLSSSSYTLACYALPFFLVYASPAPALVAATPTAPANAQTRAVAIGLWLAAAFVHATTLFEVVNRGAFGWLAVYLSFALAGVQWTALEAIVGTQVLAAFFEGLSGKVEERGGQAQTQTQTQPQTQTQAQTQPQPQLNEAFAQHTATATPAGAYTQQAKSTSTSKPAPSAYIQQPASTPATLSAGSGTATPTSLARNNSFTSMRPAHLPTAPQLVTLQH